MSKFILYLTTAAIALLLIVGGAVWKWSGTVESSPASRPMTRATPPSPDLRKPPVAVPTKIEIAQPWFRTQTDTGIHFRHDSGTSAEKPFPAANGSGIAALDYDLDGLCDLYFATGTPFPIDAARSEPINRFYRNRGAWQFQDVTTETGLGHNGYSAGVTVGDYNSDGMPDVYVACYGANVLYRNMGDGTFRRLDASSGTADDRWATSTAMLDYDGDGLLDIYVCNYGKWTLAANRWCGDQSRNIRHFCSPKSIEPEVGALLHNRGDDTFEDVTEAAGLAQRLGRAQGVVAADLNGDGTVDLYIGNDLNANSLFLNDGNGRFRDQTELSGAGYDYLGSMQAGMGVDAADTNGDGLPELFVTNFDNEANSFYENIGKGLFQEVSQQRGLYSESVPWVGWGTAFADFNLDGWLDLVVTNGHVDDNRKEVAYAEPALLWRNEKGRFVFIGPQAGDYFAASHVGRALLVADLDNDGDQDIVIGHQDGPPALLQNLKRTASDHQQPSISLRLIGSIGNRDAIGSSVTLRNGQHVQSLQVKGGGSYMSANDTRLVFAVLQGTTADQIEIRWPEGSRSILKGLSCDRSYVVIQPVSSESETRVFTVGDP